MAVILSTVASGGGHLSRGAAIALFVAHVSTMLIMIGLAVFYVVHAWRHVENENRTLWVLVLLLGAPIAGPIYWWNRIWRAPPPRRAPGVGGSAAPA